METAIAIIFSTCLVLIVWLVEKRDAWRQVGKGAIYLAGGLVCVGLLWLGAYGHIQKKQRERDQAAAGQDSRRQILLEGSIDSYLGVRLGMSKDEVLKVLGKPDGGLSIRTSETDESLRFGEALGFSATVWFSKDQVVQITCSEESKDHCPQILDVSIGDTTDDLLVKLGEPSAERIRMLGSAYFEYESENGRVVSFRIAESRVRSIGVRNFK